MTEQDYSHSVDLSTNAPTTITFEVRPHNLISRLLQKIGFIPKKRKIDVHPICLGARQRYSQALMKVKRIQNEMDNQDIVSFHLTITAEATDDLINALAIALHNRKTKPPRWLYNSLRELSEPELREVIEVLYNHLKVENFLSSIISMTGMSLQPTEIIAAEEN